MTEAMPTRQWHGFDHAIVVLTDRQSQAATFAKKKLYTLNYYQQ
jgi:hypothetical protein